MPGKLYVGVFSFLLCADPLFFSSFKLLQKVSVFLGRSLFFRRSGMIGTDTVSHYEERTKAKKKAQIDEQKEQIRAEDKEKGIYFHVGMPNIARAGKQAVM